MSIRQELTWTPFYSLLKKEVTRFLRVARQTLLVPLMNSLLYLLIFGVSLGSRIEPYGEWPYLAFLIPGILMMGVVNNAFQNSSSSISTSKFHGDLEDLRVSPLTPFQIISALSIGGLLRGLLVGSLLLILGETLYFLTTASFLPIHHPFLLFFFLVLGGLTFAQLGVSIAFWAKNFDQMSAFGGFILLPLMYLGGVFFSLNQLHPYWQMASRLNPMLYFINGVRFGILGQSDISWTTAATFSVLSLFIASFFAWRNIKDGHYGRW